MQQWIQRSQQKLGWYRGLRGAWHETLAPAGIVVHPLPAELPTAARAAFNAVASRRYPEASVAFLTGAHLFSREGLVLTGDNRVLAEYYHQFGTRPVSRRALERPFGLTRTTVLRIDAALALLAAPQGWNYYHWLFDVLPRLHLLARWRGVIERFAVPANLSPVQLETLTLLGIAPSQLQLLNEGERLRCQNLYVPSLPGSEGCYPPWSLEFLRASFLPAAAECRGLGPRIYVSRGPAASRPVLNEPALVEMLRARGFAIVSLETHSFREQVAIFRDARMVVAAHGAGLANLVFASPGTALLELFSPDYLRPDCYFTLARRNALAYDCCLDDVSPGTRQPWGAIVADLTAIARKLDAFPATSNPS